MGLFLLKRLATLVGTLIGASVIVKRKFSYDDSLEIKLDNKPALTISGQLAKNIFVKHG